MTRRYSAGDSFFQLPRPTNMPRTTTISLESPPVGSAISGTSLLSRMAGIRDSKRARVIFHAALLVVVTSIPPLFLISRGAWSDLLLWQAFTLVGCTIPFYLLHIRVLVPQLMIKRGRYGLYFLSFIPTYAGVWAVVWVMANLLGINEQPPMPQEVVEGGRPFPGGGLVFPFMIIFALGVMFELLIDSERRKRREAQARKEKTQTELAFLKSQINPHFLFNSLNTIYGLALTKDDKTENAIVLLSDLMRYMLYESDTDQMPLRKEIEFMEKYIALHRMRLSDKKNIAIQFNVEGDIDNIKMEPLLLVPFVENAFKHGISYREESWVRICLLVEGQQLAFAVENSRHTHVQPKESSGIGLTNTRQRLEMVYPNQHRLRLAESEETYSVSLTLETT